MDEILEVRSSKLRRVSQTLTLEVLLRPSTTLEMEVGRSAGKQLMALARRFAPGSD